MSEFHIIKKGHLYLHDYMEACQECTDIKKCKEEHRPIQSSPVWDFNYVGCFLFERSYGLQVAQNVAGTLYEIDDPNLRKDQSHQPKIGIMVRSFEERKE